MQGLIAAGITLILAIGLIAGFIAWGGLLERRRTARLRLLAESLGAEFQARIKGLPDPGLSGCRLFRRGADGEITNLFRFTGKRRLVFDFCDLVGSEHGARRQHQTVVALGRSAGPTFAVRPLTSRETVASGMIVPLARGDDRTADHDEGQRTDPEQPTLTLDGDEDFNGRFRVYASDPAVQAVLRNGLRDHLMRLGDVSVDASGSWCLTYRDGVRVAAAEIPALVELAESLSALA